MKNLKIIFFFLSTLTLYAQDKAFLTAEDGQIVDRNGKNVLLRGIGLGGHMLQEGYMLKVPFSGQQYIFKQHLEELMGQEKTEAFYEAWLRNHTREIDIDSLKQWGFNSVRLPMHYNLYTLPVEEEPIRGENTWLEKGFAMTDSLLNWCRKNEMYLILDMHAAPGGQGHDVNISDRDPNKPSLWESEDNKRKLIALWSKLAARYKNEPWIAAYDIINEPNWSFEEGKHKHGIEDSLNLPLKKLLKDITAAIREEDKNHIIIIEGNGWGNNYNGILPPWDSNMVLSFHKYWNYNDPSSIERFLTYRDQYNIPIWLGETGENSNVWFSDAVRLMEDHNIGWCWWPLKKLGFNNPLEIPVNPGYEQILAYWSGEAEKPSEEQAFSAMMELAENTKLENNYFHKGVVDALMRRPHTDEILPFKRHEIPTSEIIKAADYDMGTLGIAYFDQVSANYYISTGGERTSWNNGRTYRNDGVDIYPDKRAADYEEVFVGDFEAGEWLHYTFFVLEDGNYDLVLNVLSEVPSSGFVQLNQQAALPFDLTNSSDTWQEIEISKLPLIQGKNTLKIGIKKGILDFKNFRFQKKL